MSDFSKSLEIARQVLKKENPELASFEGANAVTSAMLTAGFTTIAVIVAGFLFNVYVNDWRGVFIVISVAAARYWYLNRKTEAYQKRLFEIANLLEGQEEQ
ncbi:MAG: hypothetical protein Q8J98_13000 [Phaeovulum sp.]|uniref:hypothetical protein n=1 Tax=Phaeovulum sp. TaxID=2934796 RepID=UPI0027316059|nr:hypothetical protein [Phaeovulum sp.]MDP2064006.1 hypothetical protein [Phaeovulum sp.]